MTISEFVWHNGMDHKISTYNKLRFESYRCTVTHRAIEIYNNDTYKTTEIHIFSSAEHDNMMYRLEFFGEQKRLLKELANKLYIAEMPHFTGDKHPFSFFVATRNNISNLFKEIFKKRDTGFN